MIGSPTAPASRPPGRVVIALMLGVMGVIVACSAPHAAATKDSQLMTISEPSAEHRSGRKLYTLNNPAKLAPLQDIVVNDALMHPPITGEVRVNPSNLDTVLRGATPVAPGDPRIDGWAYSPLSSATFRVNGRAWSVKFFLGGLGELTDDAGRRAAFMFVLPSS